MIMENSEIRRKSVCYIVSLRLPTLENFCYRQPRFGKLLGFSKGNRRQEANWIVNSDKSRRALKRGFFKMLFYFIASEPENMQT